MKNYILFFIFLTIGLHSHTTAQTKAITIEDIWQNYSFFPKSVPGFNFQNDGKHYTRNIQGTIQQFDITTGQVTEIIYEPSMVQGTENFDGTFDSYKFNADESKLLLATGTESIYRRSSKANYFVFDRNTKSTKVVFADGKHMYASFSPDANKVAFVFENDMYYKDLATDKVVRITNDGKYNHIINGSADWVYEEEFSMSKSFKWSPDGQKIAFLKFDESQVKEFTMTLYNNGPYPEYETFKYPKVGEKNANVSVHIFDLNTGQTTKAKTGDEPDMYYPRIRWTKDANQLCIYKMNRHQNELELLLADAKTGTCQSMLKEKNKYYIDIDDDMTFLPDGKCFFWTSEKDGFNHIYLYDLKGKMIRQITKGNFDVTNFYGYDEERKTLFYQAAEVSPLDREIYSISLKGKNKQRLTPNKGTNSVQLSSTFDYYVNTFSSVNSPSTYTVYDLSGKAIRVIEDNAASKTMLDGFGTSPVEFMNIKTESNVNLNAWMIKPPNFDESQQYPVFMYVYGGPGSQTVKNSWLGSNYGWFQMLAQKGYIVVSVDNRGTGARGQEFKKMTYLQLGHYETIDQIESAKYLGKLPYVDASRIGIFGWSYGGYMSSLCLFKGADVFKSAIAVAPVTNWKWYDSIYTERYMRTYKENEEGYENNSPVNFADRLKGNYLLVHGVADDNVHFQNTTEMVNALVNANKQFDTYFYPNRNHGIFGGNTRLHLYTKMTDFILENL